MLMLDAYTGSVKKATLSTVGHVVDAFANNSGEMRGIITEGEENSRFDPETVVFNIVRGEFFAGHGYVVGPSQRITFSKYLHLRDVSDMFGSEDEVLLYRENRTKRESGRRRQTHQLQIHRGMPVWRANEPLEVTLGALSLVNVGTRTPTYGVIVAENNGILPQQIPEDWTPFRLTDMSKTLAELTKDSADSHQLSLMVEHVKARRSKGLPWSNQVWMKDMKVWDLVEVRVGRNSWCEVQILSMESSGKHAEFYVCPVDSSGLSLHIITLSSIYLIKHTFGKKIEHYHAAIPLYE
mmetsp:Transcript_6639/g.9367  ORF Transcript_6639/g.9367 Transcript_6639/m.9367 type:complete len:295 (+) Transcript_6639:127-1011(+)